MVLYDEWSRLGGATSSLKLSHRGTGAWKDIAAAAAESGDCLISITMFGWQGLYLIHVLEDAAFACG